MVATIQARKRQLVRDTIWDAAIDLFSHQGFDETTVEEIAEAAGVSRRSFFRYFSSKNDLMAQGVVNHGAELILAIEACPKTYSLSEVFRETVLQVARQSASDPRTRKLMEIAAKHPAARAAQITRLPEVQDRIAEALSRRSRKGSGKDPKHSILAGLILAILAMTFRLWFEQGRRDITGMVDLVLGTFGSLIGEGNHPPYF